MPQVVSLTFTDWNGNTTTVPFLHDIEPNSRGSFRTTIVTGQNGSKKSTLLRSLVAALAVNRQDTATLILTGLKDQSQPIHVICCSGAVADRFPDKEVAGRPTAFDVPSYSYLGQRVGKNLLSKKRPLEAMLASALAESSQERFRWQFYRTAHEMAGIQDVTTFEFLAKRTVGDLERLLDDVCELSVLPDEAVAQVRHLHRSAPSSGHKKFLFSPARARWLRETFSEDTFSELRYHLSASKKLSMSMGPYGLRCEKITNRALRLGLLTDSVTLTHANVTSARFGEVFSAYDLSSGEYHMFTSILALGFGIQPSSVVLVDEPETSLHPQWQRDFMDALIGICQSALHEGHLVVSTHSPLIVASAPVGSSVVDLSMADPTASSALFGASSDELLLSQFGMASTRNRLVVDAVQRAVSLVERGGFGTEEFLAMGPELLTIRDALRANDPLADVINALVGGEVKAS